MNESIKKGSVKQRAEVNKVSVSYLIMSHCTPGNRLQEGIQSQTSPFFRLACPPGRPHSRSGSRWSPSLSPPSRRSRSEARLHLRASLQKPEHSGTRSVSLMAKISNIVFNEMWDIQSVLNLPFLYSSHNNYKPKLYTRIHACVQAHPSYSSTNNIMDIPLTAGKESKILNYIYFPFLFIS